MSAFEDEMRSALGTFVPDFVRQDGAELWTPLPGPQTMARITLADETFFGGSGGGGKSDLLLGLATTEHRSSVIFRSEFAQFRGPDGMIERSKEIIGARGRLNESTFEWRNLPGGRAFQFAGVKFAKDLLKWKGRPHDLKAFDELPEIPEAFYRFLIGWLRTSVEGQRTRVVSTGNPPTTPQGQWVIKYWAPWLDKQHPNPAKDGELRWFAMIDGKDVEVPTADPVRDSKGEMIRPRSRTFIRSRVEDNPYYMRTGYVDVLNNLPEPLRSQLRYGDFTATQDDDPWQVIPTAWVEAAQRRWIERPKPDAPLTAIGVDPSRGGKDKFCLTKRYANWFDQTEKHEGSEAPDGKAGAALIHKALGGVRVPANIDIIGTAGASVYDQARDLKIAVVALNGSEKSEARDKSGRLTFVNKRAAWHWKFREDLDPDSGQDICLPPDAELLSDLCAARWRITPRGIQVEEKEAIKERLGRSPDVGESTIYAHAEEDGAGMGFLKWAKQAAEDAKAAKKDDAPASAKKKAEPPPDDAHCPHTHTKKVWNKDAGDWGYECLQCLRVLTGPGGDDAENPFMELL